MCSVLYNPIAQYRQVRAQGGVEQADPHRLIAMLLDGAIERITAASGHMIRQEIAEKSMNISRTLAIVDGLRTSLDFKAGGKMATQLDVLYGYIGWRLIMANLDNDPSILLEVIKLLRTIKEGWDGIAPTPRLQSAVTTEEMMKK